MTSDDNQRSGSRGHGEKMDRKKQAAIAALLTHPTIEKAAQTVGISEATLWRWLQLPEFATAYHQARDQVLEQTLSLLHKATNSAVGTLVRNLKCGTPSVEVRAAIGILDQTFKAKELLEMESRLSEIEHSLELSKRADETRRRVGYGA